MTANSFAEYIEQTEPITLRASHYDLAPDAYGLDDGYAWAFSERARGEYIANANVPTDQNDPETGMPAANARTYQARHHLAEGGEWPYYIAAKPSPVASRADEYTAAGALSGYHETAHMGNPATFMPDYQPVTADEARAALTEGRVLETYCEGDLTAYIFDTREDRDGAADAWQESATEYAARVLTEDHHVGDGEAESLGAAIVYMWADHSGHGQSAADRITRDDIAKWFAKRVYDGSAADYWAEFIEELTSENERAALCGAWDYIDWESYARDRAADMGIREHGGYIFDTEA